MRLRIYLDVLRVPSVTRLLSSAVVGRMPTGMAGLAIVLLVREAGASYAVAGMVAGTYSGALALSSPVLGRLVDRVGQTRVLVGCAVASALSFGALAAAGGFASPLALGGLAAPAGGAIPPGGGGGGARSAPRAPRASRRGSWSGHRWRSGSSCRPRRWSPCWRPASRRPRPCS